MAKKKEVEEKSIDQVWIYEGERRPVVVHAKNERHAKDKVRKSPNYDGFPIYVVPIGKFLAKCAPVEEVPAPAAGPEEKKIDDSKVFIAIKVVGGFLKEVKVYSDEAASKRDADKIAEHLDKSRDDLKIFAIDNHQEIGENEFLDAKEHYCATKVEEKKKEVS